MTRPNPSGTNTTKQTTIKLQVSGSFPRMYNNMLSVDAICTTIVTINKIKIIADPINATFVIWEAKFYNFACNGVSF